ncbi:MAG TPA: hypothetical protein VNT75_14995 [Symbiobacteriaceae bacterium]|nr:hypothetical protein [Symbiobacteriaceae bacterium]
MNALPQSSPLRVGVVGHRDLPQMNMEQLHAAICSALSAIMEMGTEFRLVSSLAAGADQIVAEIALQPPFGFRLHCPLPFSRREYARDFGAAADRYETLLGQAEAVVELGGSRSDPDAAYKAAGELLLAESDVVLAIWDGRPGRGRAGTAPMVETALAMGLPVVWIEAAAPHRVRLLPEVDGAGPDWPLELRTQVLKRAQSGAPLEPPAGTLRFDPPHIPSAWVQHDARVPLVVGVTGHRDILPEHEKRLRRKVRHLFLRLRRLCPHTPLVILSPLAAGADCLAAEVALTIPDTRLVAPLPLSEAAYEAYVDEPWLVRHRQLLAQATPKFVMPRVGVDEMQFIAASAYVARHCHMLLALWDGVEHPELQAGSAATVRYRLHGGQVPFAPERGPLAPPEMGPVCHIVTPRAGQAEPADAFQVKYPLPEGAESAALERALFLTMIRRVDEFNAALGECPVDLLASRRHLLPGIPDAWAHGQMQVGEYLQRELHAAPPEVRRLLDRYAAADSLAMDYQARTVDTTRGLLVMALPLVFLFNLYDSDLSNAHPLVLAGYIACLALALLAWWQTQRIGAKRRYLQYRALAEGMRVQIMWRLLGLTEDVADHYLRRERGEEDWIRLALRVWNIPGPRPDDPSAPEVTPEAATVPAEAPERVETVLRCWVLAQANYYRRKLADDRKQHRALGGWTQGFFAAGLVAALGALAVRIPQWLKDPARDLPAGDQLALLLLPMLPAIAAVVDTYSEKLALSDQSKQFERTMPVFARAAEKMAASHALQDWPEFWSLARSLGEHALAEHSAWLETHRERSLPAPKG